MYYLLDPHLSLCGYKGLPFGMRSSITNEVDFFTREQYELVLMLNGETEVNKDALTEVQAKLLERLIKMEAVKEVSEKTPLSPEQQYRNYPGMYKRDVQWSITGACNYRCRHCFMSAPECRYAEPSLDECMDTVRQLAECGIKTVSLTGGEPLVSPWFYDILDECRQNGITVATVYSNGALVNEQLVEELKKRDMRPAFHMSFDGLGQHDWLRGIDGAEEKVVKAFRLMKENGFPVSSSMCLHRHNLADLNENLRFLDSLGLSHVKTNIASPAGMWAKETEHFLDFEETYTYLLNTAIPQYLSDGLKVGVQFCGLADIAPGKSAYIPMAKFSGKETSLSRYACGAVKNSMYISPEGYVLPCMTMVGTPIQEQFPNMREIPLSQILSDSSYTRACFTKAQEVVDHNAECAGCSYRFSCGGGCRACPDDENCTDYLALDESTCKFFKNGWFEKATELMKELDKEE